MRRVLHAGIDVGSTTTKLVVAEKKTGKILYSSYVRHEAVQIRSVSNCLRTLAKKFSRDEIHLVLTGSGSKELADRLGLQYVQETVANSIAVRYLYGDMELPLSWAARMPRLFSFRRMQEQVS